jgi:hypothetical protein
MATGISRNGRGRNYLRSDAVRSEVSKLTADGTARGPRGLQSMRDLLTIREIYMHDDFRLIHDGGNSGVLSV